MRCAPSSRPDARVFCALLLGEELFRAGLISREELRGIWEGVRKAGSGFDPAVDEPRALVAAALAAGALSEGRAKALLAGLGEK